LDRRFTFANPQVIKTLQTQFITAVGNTHELQNQHFDSSKWFMGMVAGVNPRGVSGTAQGFYVAAADGKGYGFNNNRDPQRVLDFMNRGLTKFQQDPPSKVDISENAVKSQFTRGPAPETSVLQVYSRIKPLPKSCDELNGGIGRDFLWVYPDEVKSIRATGQIPSDLVQRLVRFHLVDNVRGEPTMWKVSEVKKAGFTLSRLGENRYALHGVFAMSTGDNARGLEGTVDGELTLSSKEDRVAGFKAFAQTKAWGAGPYTPSPPPGKFDLVFAVVPAVASYAKDTPPAAALYGDYEYRHPK
jgi:hypothetical protein